MTTSHSEPAASAIIICDCCNVNPSIGVASSGYGAISFAWCKECVNHPTHPEPEFILVYLYYVVGDHGKGLVEDAQLPGTFKDERYWTWREWANWAATQPDPEFLEEGGA